MPRPRETGLDVWLLPPGERNLISDVPGVLVGHATIIRGRPRRGVSRGIARTGVTVVLVDQRDLYLAPVRAGVAVINGYGKALGLHQVEETGRVETPIAITNTLSIWDVGKAIACRVLEQHSDVYSVSPVVGECCDRYLNDIRGFHVKARHVRTAIENAKADFETGCVGAGTGMRGVGFKSGVGSSSRMVHVGRRRWVVGVCLVANTGRLENLRTGGFPVGLYLSGEKNLSESEKGSIIVVVATDAPLTSRQLRRVAKRVCHGLGRVGMTSGHGSGDFAIAFSTAPAPEMARIRVPSSPSRKAKHIREENITPFFDAVVEATEEAFLDAVFQSTDMSGVEGHTVRAVDVDRIARMLSKTGLVGHVQNGKNRAGR